MTSKKTSRTLSTCLLIWLVALALPGISVLAPAWAAETADQAPPVTTRFELYRLPEKTAPSQAAGQPLLAVLWVIPKPGWHAYSHEPGETGQPTSLIAALHPGDMALEPLYPPGKRTKDVLDPSKTVSVYEEPTPLFLPLPEPGQSDSIAARLTLLACSDVSCWPVRQQLRLPLENAAAAPDAAAQPWWPLYLSLSRAASGPGGQAASSAQPSTADDGTPRAGSPAPGIAPAPDGAPILVPPTEAYGVAEAMDKVPAERWELAPRYFQPGLEVRQLWKAALFALLGGFILNFMPCVLPVISLKVFGMLAASHDMADAKRQHAVFRAKNFWFAVGVLLFFAALSLLFGLTNMAWGQLFQRPRVVLTMTAAVFALGLSLFGVWDLPVIDLKKNVSDTRHPRLQSLFTGFLATLLATPCSGPFLGGALGWALTQEPGVVTAVFLCIGLGMSSPFLLLALRPEWGRFFPRPGAWMIHIERIMAFILMATCIYLFNILPAEYHVSTLILLLVVAFSAWMWGKWTDLRDTSLNRWSVRALALALALGVFWWAGTPSLSTAHWRPFKSEEFRAALGREAMILDFTADWCPNCKLLERTVLTEKNLASWQKTYGFKLVQADMTHERPDALALLRALGSQSIPVVAIFPAGEGSGRPLVLRDFFTTGQFEEALRQALEK